MAASRRTTAVPVVTTVDLALVTTGLVGPIRAAVRIPDTGRIEVTWLAFHNFLLTSQRHLPSPLPTAFIFSIPSLYLCLSPPAWRQVPYTSTTCPNRMPCPSTNWLYSERRRGGRSPPRRGSPEISSPRSLPQRNSREPYRFSSPAGHPQPRNDFDAERAIDWHMTRDRSPARHVSPRFGSSPPKIRGYFREP